MSTNSDEIKQCVLRSRNYKLRDVVLLDQVPIIIGRGPQTKIRDRKCSKNQGIISSDILFVKDISFHMTQIQ